MELYKIFAIINRAIKGLHCICLLYHFSIETKQNVEAHSQERQKTSLSDIANIVAADALVTPGAMILTYFP